MSRETRCNLKRISKKNKWCKMMLSIVLTAAMVVGNLGGQIRSVLAYDYSDAVIFDLTSRDVYYSIQDAVENGVALTTDTINFTNGKINKYRNLFYGETKKASERISTAEDEAAFRVVEFFPEYEADMEAELRTFVCLPLDSDENYQLTGSEPVIFLYINNSGETMKYFVEMDGRKKNSAVVKSYEEAFGEDEVEIISPDYNTEAESSSAELETTEGTQESTEKSESAQTAEDETVQTTDESQTEDVTEEGTLASKDEADTGDETDTKDESDTESGAETEDVSDIEDETEAKEERVDKTELEDNQGVLEVQASITRHNIPMVAVAIEENDFQEKASEAIEAINDITEEDIISSEATAEADDGTTSAVDESEEVAEASGAIEEVKESLTEVGTETEEKDESTVETMESGEVEPDTQEETVQPSSETAEETEISVNDKAEHEESGSIAEGKYPLVGIDFCCTAKSYVTNIHNLGVNLDAMDDGFFWQQEMADGVTVTLKADDMAARELTSDVSASIQDISEAAREAIAQNMGVSAQDVIAYDINLLDAEGNVIENESWQGRVTVSFSGSRIEELSSANDSLAVIHEASEVDGTALDITAEQLEIEVLSTVEAEGAKTVDEVSGNAVSFSITGVVPNNRGGTDRFGVRMGGCRMERR